MLQHTLKIITSCSKDKGKNVYLLSAFMIDDISSCKSQMAFMGLDLQSE